MQVKTDLSKLIDQKTASSTDSRKPALLVIFMTVFLYLVGFGVVIPIIPLLSRDYGATALQSGLLMSSYSLMQFLFSPFWGKLSDKYGRRPILLFCLLCECLCYILFAFSHNLTMLFVARALAGFFGASLSTASAYISDITPPQERSKGMALIGVAFGLGFIVGPAIGGLLSKLGSVLLTRVDFLIFFNFIPTSALQQLPTSLPSLFVAVLCLLNFAYGLKYLVESKGSMVQPEPHLQAKSDRLGLILKSLRLDTVGLLIVIFFLASFAMSSMETTFVLYMGNRFNWSTADVSYGFAYIGFIMIFTQGYLVRKLLPMWGERKTLRLGLILLSLGLILMGLAPTVTMMAVGVTCLGIGSGLTNPSTLGSISLLTPAENQGQILGVTQSLSSLGRIFGPIFGGILFDRLGTAVIGESSRPYSASPFFFGGVLAFFGLLFLMRIYSKIPESAKKTAT